MKVSLDWARYAHTFFIKQLRLVPAEEAERHGIPAEAPTFLSPYVHGSKRCTVSGCGVHYRPLVYQTGYTTTAHHYHGIGEGGIYFYISPEPQLPCSIPNEAGWIAQVEPLGEWATRDTFVGQAPAVRCLDITAWCTADLPEMRDHPNQSHPAHPITSGVLVLLPDLDGSRGRFLPVCEHHSLEPWLAPLRFQILDGTVYSQRRS